MLFLSHCDVMTLQRHKNDVFTMFSVCPVTYSFSAVLFRDLDRPSGDKTYCDRFRKINSYNEDSWFLDVVDIAVMDFLMSHMDARHTYIRLSSGARFNVMFDFGRA